ncbi:uncharacterized protein TNCV_4194891 [Trichonephila clavipes]|nr:uncharacterized protein TNCV_4194891 [Trichonephila clavipes]
MGVQMPVSNIQMRITPLHVKTFIFGLTAERIQDYRKGHTLVQQQDVYNSNCGRKRLRNQLQNNLVALHFKYDQARRRFVEWAQNEIAVVPDFHQRIFFSDEAHFWLNSYVNKQNCRIWSEANPQVNVETPLHPEKLTVWCPLWAGGIIGPYFFKNDEGHNVKVNGDLGIEP